MFTPFSYFMSSSHFTLFTPFTPALDSLAQEHAGLDVPHRRNNAAAVNKPHAQDIGVLQPPPAERKQPRIGWVMVPHILFFCIVCVRHGRANDMMSTCSAVSVQCAGNCTQPLRIIS